MWEMLKTIGQQLIRNMPLRNRLPGHATLHAWHK